jgi:putative transcriptional regulator
MPIVVNLDVMLAKRKRRLIDLAQVVDITPANLSVLKSGRARAIRFSTLEAICRALDCQPGDLLEYQPESHASPAAVPSPATSPDSTPDFSSAQTA